MKNITKIELKEKNTSPIKYTPICTQKACNKLALLLLSDGQRKRNFWGSCFQFFQDFLFSSLPLQELLKLFLFAKTERENRFSELLFQATLTDSPYVVKFGSFRFIISVYRPPKLFFEILTYLINKWQWCLLIHQKKKGPSQISSVPEVTLREPPSLETQPSPEKWPAKTAIVLFSIREGSLLGASFRRRFNFSRVCNVFFLPVSDSLQFLAFSRFLCFFSAGSIGFDLGR